MSENLETTKYSQLCGDMANYSKVMSFDSEHPLPWNQMIVSSEDANDDPLVTEYYLNDIFQFKVTKTFFSNGKVSSIIIS